MEDAHVILGPSERMPDRPIVRARHGVDQNKVRENADQPTVKRSRLIMRRIIFIQESPAIERR
jgi:hypothetical protein